MVYSKQTWRNNPSGGTPLSADRLTHVEDGIDEIAQVVFTGRLSADELEGQFLEVGGTGAGYHIDSTRPVNAAQRMKQELISVTATGDVVITLGAVPISAQVAVWVKTGSAVPARLLPTGYAVDSNVVTVPALLSGDKILIEYMYDSDVNANPAASATNQYDVYDNFERTVAATTGTGLGAATTGQTPTIFGGGTWQLDGHTLRKGVAGGTPSQDCVYWVTSNVNGWLETVYNTAGTGTAPAGLACRGNTSTTRIHTLSDGMSVRTSSTDVRAFTSISAFVKGDGCGVLMNGSNFKLYRRPANTGAWQYNGEFTLASATATSFPTLLTSTSHGIRNANSSNTDTEFDYFKFIAGATVPPVVS